MLRNPPIFACFLLLFLLGCGPRIPDFPAPDAWGGVRGPGGPALGFGSEELQVHCSFLDGGELDEDHHNLVVMYDGYLVFPWVPESGGGGLSLVDFSDPCNPATVGSGFSESMRESHSVAFSDVAGGRWAVVNDMAGVQFWNLSDPSAPRVASVLALPDVIYPDAYIQVVLSVFWQGPYVFASSGFNGVFVIDASDPLNPSHVATYKTDPPIGVGSLHAVGSLGMISSSGGAGTQLVDLSDPLNIRARPGGDFLVHSSEEVPRAYYFANLSGPYALFARNEVTGGPIIYDISNPASPSFVADAPTAGGNGGYLSWKSDRLFVGDSEDARVYDVSEPAAPVELMVLDLPGDLDTATPIGNVVVLSVDEGAPDGEASSIIPVGAEPDGVPPRVGFHWPPDGAINQSTGTRIGLSFDEMVEPISVFVGSLRVWDADGELVEGLFNAQENLVNFTPSEALLPDMTYFVEAPAGGIVDDSGNAMNEAVTFRFATGPTLADPL